MALDPLYLVGEGAVEDAGVVGADSQAHIGGEEAVYRVCLRVGYCADAQVGGGAGFDDHAELAQAIEDEVLAAAHVGEALGGVSAVDGLVAGPVGEIVELALKGSGIDGHAASLEVVPIAEIVADLGDALIDQFEFVGLRAPGDGGGGIEAERGAVAKADRAQLGGLVAPAHGAFERLVEVDFADVVGHVERAAGSELVVAAQALEEGAGARGRRALLKVAEVEADNGGHQAFVFVEQALDQVVAFERGPARQADQIARLEVGGVGFVDDAGGALVELYEGVGLGVVVGGHRAIFDIAQAFAAVVGDDPAPDLVLVAERAPPMAIDADGHVELGLELSEVAAVAVAVDIVVFERVELAALKGIAEERDRVGTLAVGLFELVDVERPVDVLIVFAGQIEQIFGEDPAAHVDVEFAGLGGLQQSLGHRYCQYWEKTAAN